MRGGGGVGCFRKKSTKYFLTFPNKVQKVFVDLSIKNVFRFDTIFIVKDEHDEARDMTLARHVMKVSSSPVLSNLSRKALEQTAPTNRNNQVHMNAAADNAVEGELSLAFLKKYLGYCRSLAFYQMLKWIHITIKEMAPLTPILSLISRFSQGSLWPKVDRGGCRETEEPLCADEELEPRGSFQDNFVTFLEAFSSSRWRRRVRSGWPSPSLWGSWRRWWGSPRASPRWHSSLSSPTPTSRKLWDFSKWAIWSFWYGSNSRWLFCAFLTKFTWCTYEDNSQVLV